MSATGINGLIVTFCRTGRAAKGEPSTVCRRYRYQTEQQAAEAFFADTVGKGRPIN